MASPSLRMRHLWIAASVVVVIWGACLGFMLLVFDTWEDRGQAGDLFGAVNALFSGLAFSALVITILMQRDELQLQREELRLTRQEMSKQRETLAEQAKAQNAQRDAAIAAIRVASLEAKIRAVDVRVPKGTLEQDYHIQAEKEINSIAEEIKTIADFLEAAK